MAKEIERKFLVVGKPWKKFKCKEHIIQGYLPSGKGVTTRVRLDNVRAYITIKGPSRGISRDEYEYQIPPEDAREMLQNLCLKPLIYKTRFVTEIAGLTWEVDVFKQANKGLVIAEVELQSPSQKIQLPSWVGKEVSGNKRFNNSKLVKNPYSQWKRKEKW